MGAAVPESVAKNPFHDDLARAGLKRAHQGKVRDTYLLLDDGLLLVVATNRVSIFDFVLPASVERKGEVLTAMTVFWLTEVLSDIKHHLVAFGADIDRHLPLALRGDAELQKRALVVKRVKIIPVEAIVRGYLTGSAWRSYQRDGTVFGTPLKPGLHDGSLLRPPLFTPTTKAEGGHDEDLDAEEVVQQYGPWIRDQSVKIYEDLAGVAVKRGWLVADTKFEWGEGEVLADEVVTPDSSRFWRERDWRAAAREHRSPSPFDKEVVRDWGKGVKLPESLGVEGVGIGRLNPADPAHLSFVHSLQVPADLLADTTRRYERVFEGVVRDTLGGFQRAKMGIDA